MSTQTEKWNLMLKPGPNDTAILMQARPHGHRGTFTWASLPKHVAEYCSVEGGPVMAHCTWSELMAARANSDKRAPIKARQWVTETIERRRHPRLPSHELRKQRHRIRANLQVFLDEHGTVGSLARSCYKYTDAGISVACRLDDGTCLWSGDEGQYNEALMPRVVALGVSSIVEGSDAEVPLEWIELHEPDAVAAFWRLCDAVDAEAQALWHEANDDDDDDGEPS